MLFNIKLFRVSELGHGSGFENKLFHFVFRTVILPVFRENEEKIDKVVNQGKEKLAELAEKTMEDKKET